MKLFLILTLELCLLATGYNLVSNLSTKVDHSSSGLIGQNFVSRTKSNLANFIFTLSKPAGSNDTREESEPMQVDCFGLGKTLATALELFFLSGAYRTSTFNIRFYLSSRKKPERVLVLTGEQFGLEWTDFRIERKTVFIVHGFLSHGLESWIVDMERAFLLWGDVNVVIVDWSAGGNTWNYYKAASNTQIVGHEISRFLEHLENATTTAKENWGPLYFVGHSLGGHICGFASKTLKKRQSDWTIERITGLDPAQPCFVNANASMKLDKSDAFFVDIIHTNGKLLSEMGLGMPTPIGHVDFYPNGGRSQPGCQRSNNGFYDRLPIPISSIKKSICSHGRSQVYLTESLHSCVNNNCTFWARQWDLTFKNLIHELVKPCNKTICTEMGIKAIDHAPRGTFYVATSNDPPFCIRRKIMDKVKTRLAEERIDELEDWQTE